MSKTHLINPEKIKQIPVHLITIPLVKGKRHRHAPKTYQQGFKIGVKSEGEFIVVKLFQQVFNSTSGHVKFKPYEVRISAKKYGVIQANAIAAEMFALNQIMTYVDGHEGSKVPPIYYFKDFNKQANYFQNKYPELQKLILQPVCRFTVNKKTTNLEVPLEEV